MILLQFFFQIFNLPGLNDPSLGTIRKKLAVVAVNVSAYDNCACEKKVGRKKINKFICQNNHHFHNNNNNNDSPGLDEKILMSWQLDRLQMDMHHQITIF